MSISHAIATAVNTVKRWCKGGTISSTKGPTKSGNVTAATKAKACKAVTEWNAKKAKAGKKLGMDRDAYSDHDMVLELSQTIVERDLWPARENEFEEDFDPDTFLLHLSQERESLGLESDDYDDESLYMSIFNWDPALHPRNLLGQFRRVLSNLGDGDAVELPGGTQVKKQLGGFTVDTPNSKHPNGEIFEKVDDAVENALDADSSTDFTKTPHMPRDPKTGKIYDPGANFDPGKHPRDGDQFRSPDASDLGELDEPDSMRYATPGERGDLEYFDTREEAEQMAEELGGEIIEIPEGDRKWRVVDERMDVYEFDSEEEARKEFGPSIDAGEVNMNPGKTDADPRRNV